MSNNAIEHFVSRNIESWLVSLTAFSIFGEKVDSCVTQLYHNLFSISVRHQSNQLVIIQFRFSDIFRRKINFVAPVR